MPFLLDIWHAIHAIVTTSDLITLGIMAVIALGAGLLMHSYGSIVTTTVIALVAFALAGYARAVVTGQNASAFAASDWQAFLSLQMRQFMPYVLIFVMGIAIAHTARTLIARWS